ncbi:hypothetical protein [Kibdelosporangium philippinense]|uniref:hypothetical protein n=1 Tax=Kibdelosporangium philippinense TaxID=211113 RepID=UPI00360DCF7C
MRTHDAGTPDSNAPSKNGKRGDFRMAGARRALGCEVDAGVGEICHTVRSLWR